MVARPPSARIVGCFYSRAQAHSRGGHTGWFHGHRRDLGGGALAEGCLPEKFSGSQSEAPKHQGALPFLQLYKAGKTKQLGEEDQSKASIQGYSCALVRFVRPGRARRAAARFRGCEEQAGAGEAA